MQTFYVRCNAIHWTLEKEIKKRDDSEHMTRSALFQRLVNVALLKDDWLAVYDYLKKVKLDTNAPRFSNYQANLSDGCAENLAKIKEKIYKTLHNAGVINRLQQQFFLQLLMACYLQYLKEKEYKIETNSKEKAEIDFPELSKLFTKLILTEPDSKILEEIAGILIKWDNSN